MQNDQKWDRKRPKGNDGRCPTLCRALLCKGERRCQLLSWKLLMWPFERVLWWCCRPKDIPRDRHGEAPRVSVVCRSLRRAYSIPSNVSVTINCIQTSHMKPLRYGNTSIGERLKSIQKLVNTNGLHVNLKHWRSWKAAPAWCGNVREISTPRFSHCD